MQEKKYTLALGGKELYVKTNQMAQQANGSVIIGYGETVVLVTAVMGREPKQGYDFFPLSVEYEERFYAAGKIKGSRFIKREGRPSDDAVLSGRLIDRAIRPRFNQKMRNDVQVVATTVSFDAINDADIVALNGASVALSISDIPWNGPVGCVRIGLIDNELVVNPEYSQREKSTMDLVVAGTENRINMMEGGAQDVSEEILGKALELAYEEIKKVIAWQNEIVKDLSPKKLVIEIKEPKEDFKKIVNTFLDGRLDKAIYATDKSSRVSELGLLKKELIKYLNEQEFDDKTVAQSHDLYEEAINDLVHKNVIEKEKRPDGRALDEVRALSCQTGLLPRAHGSALFSRGTTQALASVTLGSPGMEQYLDSMEMAGKKHFMLHYNFPPFSVGEIGRYSGPGRREIGHGALAERTVFAQIPPKADFPYTVRVVSEILSSNGSSSMASVCGASLALMDAGVPIKNAVAGIAMGLMTWHDGRYKILTDIQGPEDHHGDMDCKIAGSKNGVCGIQMDVKIEGVTIPMLKETFQQAKKARLTILDAMNQAIGQPRPEVSKYAPRIIILQINPEKIGAVIGPGGKVINAIIDETGVQIDIEDDGKVFVTSDNAEGMEKAIAWIKNLTKEVKPGEIYQGKVVKIMDFGAFVEILPGQDGLVHISELAPYRVNKVSDIVKVGDVISVKVKHIEDNGKISLSLKDATSGSNNNPPEKLTD